MSMILIGNRMMNMMMNTKSHQKLSLRDHRNQDMKKENNKKDKLYNGQGIEGNLLSSRKNMFSGLKTVRCQSLLRQIIPIIFRVKTRRSIFLSIQ